MNNKKIKTIGILFLLLLVVFVVIKYYVDKHNLKKAYHVTIGNVYDYKVLVRSGYALNFNYFVNGKKYDSEYIVYNNPKIFVKKRYFVVFSLSDPRNCKILLNRPVPDEIKQAPSEGWKKIPQ